MICARKHDTVQAGDLVMLHGGYKFLTTCYVEPGATLINKFGAFRHDDMIGAEFGRLVSNSRGTTQLVVLRPSPELWSVSLAHRTQIVFSMDASVIAFRLNVRAGSVVVETGTGSGSLSHHFVRCLQPNGHLHTFEFNEHRATLAREEFARHGIDSHVTVRHTDAYGADGFGEALTHRANAVFLDLPMPWRAVANAKRALVPNGMICSFSPCVEQVQRTCAALREAGFYDICTIEALTRPFYVKDLAVVVPSGRERQLQQRRQREEREQQNLQQQQSGGGGGGGSMAGAGAVDGNGGHGGGGGAGGAAVEGAQDGAASGTADATDATDAAPARKLPRVQGSEGGVAVGAGDGASGSSGGSGGAVEGATASSGGGEPAAKTKVAAKTATVTKTLARPDMRFRPEPGKALATRPVAAIRGHTSYLTFATIRDPTRPASSSSSSSSSS